MKVSKEVIGTPSLKRRAIGKLLPLLLLVGGAAQSAEVESGTAPAPLAPIESEGIERTREAQAAQDAVELISDQTRTLVDEYQEQLKLVEGLNTYIGLLDSQLANQQEEMSDLRRSITDVAVIERQMLPLMLRMIDALEAYVALDVPFLLEERRRRVEDLKTMLERSDVAVAEKCRRVFEAYQIENDYGRTIEAYTAKLALPEGSFDVEFLRIGRLSLFYRTIGSGEVGHWNSDAAAWQALSGSRWQRLVDQGLAVARQEVAPQLIHVAIDPSGVEGP